MTEDQWLNYWFSRTGLTPDQLKKSGAFDPSNPSELNQEKFNDYYFLVAAASKANVTPDELEESGAYNVDNPGVVDQERLDQYIYQEEAKLIARNQQEQLEAQRNLERYQQEQPSAWGPYYNIVVNGVPATYVPKSFVLKGVLTGPYSYQEIKNGGWSDASSGSNKWHYDKLFLQKDTYNWLTPYALSQEEINKITGNGATDQNNYIKSSDIPAFGDGFIIERDKFNELKNKYSSETNWYAGMPRIPSVSGGLTEINGVLHYVGQTADTSGWSQRSDQVIIRPDGSGLYTYAWSKGVQNIPVLNVIDKIARIVYPVYGLAASVIDYAVGTTDSPLGIGLALIGGNIPGADGVAAFEGTFLHLPQIAEFTKNISDFYQTAGLSAEGARIAAQATIAGGLDLLKTGGDFQSAFATAAASVVGQNVASAMSGVFSNIVAKDLTQVLSNVSTAATKAALLRQDVDAAATNAFITSAVPAALNSAVRMTGLADKIPLAALRAINEVATAAALLPNANLEDIIKNAVITTAAKEGLDTIAQAINLDLSAAGLPKLTTAQKDAIGATINAALSGKSLDQIVNGFNANQFQQESFRQAADQAVQKDGWQNLAERNTAQSFYGKSVTPDQWNRLGQYIDYSTGEAFGSVGELESVVDQFKSITGSEPSAQQIQGFRDVGDGSVVRGFNLSSTTQEEAKAFLEANGYKPTDNEAAAFAGFVTESNAKANIAEYVDPRQTTYEEAEAFLGELGYTPTEDEIKKFVGQVNEDAAKANIAGYVNQRQFSEVEARQVLTDLGVDPESEYGKDLISRYAKQGNQDTLSQQLNNEVVEKYVAPRAQKISDVFDYLNQGKLSPEQAQDELLNFGFTTDQLPAIFAANADAVDRARKAQDIVNDYADIGSDLSREAAVQRLVQDAGVTEAAANNYLSRVDAQVTARNDYANIARDFVANNLGTSEQAITRLRTSLANVGVTGDQQDEVVDAYNKMRLQAAGAEMTPSEMTNLAVLAAKKTGWVAIPGTSGHEVAFELTEEGDPRVVAARDKNGNNLLNQYQNLTPQGVMQVVNAQLAQSRAAEQTKGAPNQYAVDKELSDAASAAGLVRTTGMIRNNFSTVNTDYFNNLLRQYSAMSPEDRAKIASASGVTTDLRVLKDIDAQYKAIDQQYAAAVANNSPAAKIYKSLDTRVENKAGYYYTNNGVQPSTAMAMAVQDLQGGNLFNRVNLSEVQDSKFPFETKEFINQFRGTPAGDTLANVLSSAYAVAGSAAANTLNGALGINLHIAEAMGMDTFANDFRKLATGIKTAGDDAIAIANASTDAHKNLIGGLSNVVSAIPWLATGVAPGIVAGAMATTYGNEYIQGRLAGQSIDDAGKRATLMAIAEGIGERIGADEAVRLLKPLWRTTPTDQLGKVIGDSLVNQIGKYGTKEQLGELLSYSLQAGVDKTPQIGLAQDMTGMEFIKGALDTIQQTFVAAGANSGLAVGLRGNMTQDNSGSIKVISPDGSQGLVELGNGSVIRVDIPEGLDLKVGEDININALMHDAVYVPDNVNERFNTLESQLKDIYQTELGRPPTFAELDFNVRRLADGTDIQTVANELNNSQAGQLLDQRNTFNAQTDQQIAANAKSLLDQGRTTYAEFKDFMNTMGLASDRQLNVLDTITPRANVAGTVTSIIGDNAVVTGTDGQMYTMLRVAPNNYLIQVGDQVNLGVSTVKPTTTPTVEVTTKIADVIAASVSKSTSISLSQSVSEAAVSTSISKSQSLSVSYSQSQSLSASTSVSVSESQSKSISLSQSVSTVELEKSISLSKSVSTSLSTSASLSTSTSLSQSVSASTSTSQSLSASISKAVSISEALSLSASVSEQMEKDRLKGLSISASLSESISQAVSVSESISKAVSISESTSASISTSQSISQATSISQSLSASTSQSESVSKATSISASVSASTSASLSASTSQSISLSQEVSKQVSISQSTSQSISLSQSLSQSQAVSISTSVSESVVKSASASLSLSQSTSAALSTSVSQSLSLSQKMSEDIVAGLSISASLSASQSVSQSISALISESISKAQSVTQTQSPAATQTVTQSITQSVTQSITQAITQSLTESLTLSITESITQPITLAPTIMPSVTLAPSISVTETFTQTPSLTMVITTTSLPPVTTTITIPPVTTTEPVTTEQVTTVTIPPVTPPPTSGTIPPVTTPSISVPDQTTTAPITTLPVTTAPITTAVTTARPPTTTARPPTTTARPPTTTARPGGLPFPIFGIPAATGQQTTYVDYAQPKVPAPEFGPYDLFKAPSYLRPLQDSGNFGLAALIGAASESQQRNGDNQSQQNAESQGQTPTG